MCRSTNKVTKTRLLASDTPWRILFYDLSVLIVQDSSFARTLRCVLVSCQHRYTTVRIYTSVERSDLTIVRIAEIVKYRPRREIIDKLLRARSAGDVEPKEKKEGKTKPAIYLRCRAVPKKKYTATICNEITSSFGLMHLSMVIVARTRVGLVVLYEL